MVGTFVNMVAVIAGSIIGLLCKDRLSAKITENLTKSIGLCICIIGIAGAIKGDTILLVVSMALGTLIGEWIDIDRSLNRFSNRVQNKLNKNGKTHNISQGFVAATLLFCVGAMSIVGSIESGLKNDHSIIYTKSMIDGISAIVLASTLGSGVVLSSLAILAYQGGIVLFSGFLQDIFVNSLIVQISATGSIMILGLGLNMALNTKLRVANQLPGLLISVLYFYVFLQ